MGRHDNEFAGNLQIHPLPILQPCDILAANQRDGDILDLQLILPQKEQDQIQRTLKILHLLRPGVDYLFQFEYRTFQN